MGKLKIGDRVRIKNGGEAKILDEFGAGGQGTVYKVEYNNQELALKWYHPGAFSKSGKNTLKEFYANLENNISNGAPTKAFLWPIGVSEVQNGSFGYLMDIRPSGYEELTSFFVGTKKKPQVHFSSLTAQATAAINIIQAFGELHSHGYTYQDINDGNFFINPANGDVLICDNDNVSPYQTNLGIMGKQRWMAPEIVMGKLPDKLSDRFSLSVVLFRLLFINHPLEGSYSTPPCMTKELEKRYYGEAPIFVYDPSDTRNRPIPGADQNLKRFWPIYPQYIRDAFTRAFSQDVMLKKAQRILETEWLNIFFRLRAEICKCPHCGEEMFYDMGQASFKCLDCGKPVSRPAILKTNRFNLPIVAGQKIYLWHLDSDRGDIETVVAQVISNPQDKRMLGFHNVSNYTWKVTLPDGSQRPLAPGNVVPSKDGFVIDFLNSSKTQATISF